MDAEILRMAYTGYATLRDQYQNKMDEIHGMLTGAAQEHEAPGMPRKRRKFSVATREKMAASQRARWSERNAAKVNTPKKKTTRTMSAAARKAISEFQKARWKMVKAKARKSAKPKTMTAGGSGQ